MHTCLFSCLCSEFQLYYSFWLGLLFTAPCVLSSLVSWTEFLPVHITGFNYPSFYVPVCQASVSVFNSVLPVLFCFASLILSSCISFSCVSLPWCFPHPGLHCAYLSFSLSFFNVHLLNFCSSHSIIPDAVGLLMHKAYI